MRALQYHAGQIAVQQEASSRELADHMAHWVGPAAEFAMRADLLIFSYVDHDGCLRFATLSGAAPLVAMVSSSALRLAHDVTDLPDGRVGGLAINLGEARRVRLNGDVHRDSDGAVLEIEEAFTLCRKYLAPSVAAGTAARTRVAAREPVSLDDPAFRRAVQDAETSFLASVTPDGAPDVAHRGGPVGFLELEVAGGRLAWPEYLGDGVFKSAGNVRATGTVTLLVPDLATGDAYEVTGHGSYTNLRVMRGPRCDPLVRDRDAFPVQGTMEVEIERVERLPALISPRRRQLATEKVTSRSSVHDQAPQ